MNKQQFIELRATAFNTMKEAAATAGNKPVADWPADVRDKYNAAKADYEKAQESIREAEAFQRAASEMNHAPAAAGRVPDAKAERRQAFYDYMRKGEQRGTASQKTTPDSAGGFLIDDDLANEINIQQLFISDIELAARVEITQRGNDLKFPKLNDTGNSGSLRTEASRDSAAIPVLDMTFGNTTLGAYFYTSDWVTMSLELEEDIEFGVNVWLFPELARRINQAKNPNLTTGTGSGQPQGVVTASAAGLTAASQTAITHENLINLFYSVDRSYRNNARAGWMFNDTTEAAIVQLGLTPAENFNPIMFDASGEMRIMGKPVFRNKDMADLEAEAKPILFGDFGQYVIRKVQGTRIVASREAFIQKGQIGYMAAERIDGKLIGPSSAIKHIVMAAAA